MVSVMLLLLLFLFPVVAVAEFGLRVNPMSNLISYIRYFYVHRVC